MVFLWGMMYDPVKGSYNSWAHSNIAQFMLKKEISEETMAQIMKRLKVVFYILCLGIPAIGGFVVVGQMLVASEYCVSAG